MNLYLTADAIGTATGGGVVTYHESEALKEMGETRIVSRAELEKTDYGVRDNVSKWDVLAYHFFGDRVKLAHIYSGTFSACVVKLKKSGAKVAYTAAAHDIEQSKAEHELLGLAYDYPHLTDKESFKWYCKGYIEADVVVCPSEHSREVMTRYGAKNVVIIPHGCTVPEEVCPLPDKFTVGYLGAIGPDKGLPYLLQAWKRLNYKDASLVVAGSHSDSSYVRSLIERYGGGNIHLKGWVNCVDDFYNNISVYVQPSVSEGFGIEVLEAMAHARYVICSEGAGAVDVVRGAGTGGTFPVRDIETLMARIESARSQDLKSLGEQGREHAKKYTWDAVRAKYKELWKGLMG